MSLLIVTSTVHINSQQVQLGNPDTRLKQYIESILFYLNTRNVGAIIICDNSNFDYSKVELLRQTALKNNKEVEFLSFNGDSAKIYEYGKGFGEGEILEYIFKTSDTLKRYSSFYKVTGRLIVKNIDRIIDVSDPDTNYFEKSGVNPFVNLKVIDTRFYQCTVSTFSKFFLNEYEKVDDKNNHFLEHCYYNVYIENREIFHGFKKIPIISGISGSTGVVYDESDFKIFARKMLKILKL